jgi:hypothetical protein
MIPLKLRVYLLDGDKKLEKITKEQWGETSIIYEKLVRNLKNEFKNIKIINFDKSKSPYISMDIDLEEDLEEDKFIYIANYLSGNETENPVYFDDKEFFTESEIILEESVLDRFNKIFSDVGV